MRFYFHPTLIPLTHYSDLSQLRALLQGLTQVHNLALVQTRTPALAQVHLQALETTNGEKLGAGLAAQRPAMMIVQGQAARADAKALVPIDN